MLKLGDKEIGTVQVGIPIPTRPGGRAAPERVAIEELEVDHSRMFKGYTSKQLVQTCASIRKKFPERVFIVRSIGDTGMVVRVWRTK